VTVSRTGARDHRSPKVETRQPPKALGVSFRTWPSRQPSCIVFQTGENWLLAKVPQRQTQSDSLDHTNFVPTNVTQEISGLPGRKVRIAFGYGENGDPASLYCTSRQET